MASGRSPSRPNSAHSLPSRPTAPRATGSIAGALRHLDGRKWLIPIAIERREIAWYQRGGSQAAVTEDGASPTSGRAAA